MEELLPSSHIHKRDELLFLELQSLASLPFHALIRPSKRERRLAREAFFTSGTLPKFSYERAKRFDVVPYQEAVRAFRTHLDEAPGDPIILELYQAKCDELLERATVIRAMQLGDDQTVTQASKNLFGPLYFSLNSLEREWKDMMKNASSFHTHSTPVTSEIFAKMVERVLTYYDMPSWDICTHARSSVKIAHRVFYLPRIRIPKHLQISRARAARLLTHEIEVHALRTWNGMKSPFYLLWRGLDQYLPTDEGLAVFYQQQLSDSERRHAPGFWDAWTTLLTQTGTFQETFDTIAAARAELANATGDPDPEATGNDAAWRLCLRAYRGITDFSQTGVGFLRDHIYRSGLAMIQEAVQQQGEQILQRLFIGNVGLHHTKLLEQLHLKKGRMPELISPQIVREVMRET